MKAQGQINPRRNVTDSSEGTQQGTEVTGGREELGVPNSILNGNTGNSQGKWRSRNTEQCLAAVLCRCSCRLRSSNKPVGTHVLGMLGQAASNLNLVLIAAVAPLSQGGTARAGNRAVKDGDGETKMK